MNGLRILGQILLWTGFLLAAIAACSKKEYDFLPESEQTSLSKLTDGVEISKSEMAEFTPKNIEELTAEELAEVCNSIAPILKERAAEKKKKQESESETEEDPKDESEEEAEKSFTKSDFIDKRTSLIDNKWPTVNWTWYFLSMVIGMTGVVLLRRTSRTAESDSGKVAAEYSTITSSLLELRKHVAHLGSSLDKYTPHEIVNFIDDECGEPFADFADARNALVQRFGLQAFAEIMTQFASGERFMNRAWSAAADGYVNEVRDCVERANAHLERADEILTSYEKNE